MNPEKLLIRLARGNYENISFGDSQRLVEAHGFVLRRVQGSHHIYRNPALPQIVNIQEVNGQSKSYQIRQFLRLVEKHQLGMEKG